MDLLNRKTQFKTINHKIYPKIREPNHRVLSYSSKNKHAKPLRVGQKVFMKNQNVPFGKHQKLCELRREPYIETEVNTKVKYEIALDADPTLTQFIHRNHSVHYFPHDKEVPNLLSNYEQPFNDDRTEHFYNKYAKYRFSQMKQYVDSFVEGQQLNDYLPIFPDTPGSLRMDTAFNLPNKDGNSHLAPTYLTSSSNAGIPQSSLHPPFLLNRNHLS